MNDEFLVDLPSVVLAAWRRAAPPGGAGSLVFPGLDRQGLMSWIVRELRTPSAGSLLLGAGYYRLEKMSIASVPSAELARVLSELGQRLAREMHVEPDSFGFVPAFFSFHEHLAHAAAAGDFALGYALAPLAADAQRRRNSASCEAQEAIRRAMAA